MTSLLLNDDMSMNRINPYTATQTFGVSYNGGYKGVLPPDPERPESPAMLEFNPRVGVPTDHFNKLTLDDAGNMYLKTGGTHPATSFLYPARKYQFDDGSTTFGREVIIGDAKNYVSPEDFPDDAQTGRALVLGAMIILLILLAFRKGLKF
jgi:hypothetical protein